MPQLEMSNSASASPFSIVTTLALGFSPRARESSMLLAASMFGPLLAWLVEIALAACCTKVPGTGALSLEMASNLVAHAFWAPRARVLGGTREAVVRKMLATTLAMLRRTLNR